MANKQKLQAAERQAQLADDVLHNLEVELLAMEREVTETERLCVSCWKSLGHIADTSRAELAAVKQAERDFQEASLLYAKIRSKIREVAYQRSCCVSNISYYSA